MNTTMVVRVAARIAPPHLTTPIDGGPGRALAHLQVAMDVFQHHDGVVDKHTNRECDPSKRHDVQRYVVRVHEHKSADDRYRNRDSNDDC